jgi:hypothetical protein
MKRHTKVTSEQQQQQTEEHAAQQSAREFATVEEMLRHDAIHTPVPPAIAYRLRESIGRAPRPARSWWRRFFGSGK